MIDTTAQLLERQGYAATGLNQILAESGTPRGSLYYHCPGGKEELVTEAILHRALGMSRNVAQQLALHSDPSRAFDALVNPGGNEPTVSTRGRDAEFPPWYLRRTVLVNSLIAYADETECAGGAPVAAVALESSAGSPAVRDACRRAYEMLQAPIEQKLRDAGYEDAAAVSLSSHITAALEGAIILTRVQQNTAPLRATKAQIRWLLAVS